MSVSHYVKSIFNLTDYANEWHKFCENLPTLPSYEHWRDVGMWKWYITTPATFGTPLSILLMPGPKRWEFDQNHWEIEIYESSWWEIYLDGDPSENPVSRDFQKWFNRQTRFFSWEAWAEPLDFQTKIYQSGNFKKLQILLKAFEEFDMMLMDKEFAVSKQKK